MKSILPKLFALLMLPVFATAEIHHYTYSVANNQATITDYSGPGGDITIPVLLGEYPVVAIGSRAFFSLASLTNLTIPDSVTSIGDYTFVHFTNLTSVIIGNSVHTINNIAFFDCTSLTRVYFSGNAPTLGSMVFGNTLATIYYLPHTIGWGDTYAGFPTKP